jgi:hypothetical protein
MNQFEEVKYERAQSKGITQRICGSICCSLFGLLLLYPGGLFLAGWNERRTVCVEKATLVAADQLEEVKCSANPSNLAGKLIFATCPISSFTEWTPGSFDGMENLKDAFSKSAVSASQVVEMLQCVEAQKTREESTGDSKTKKTITTYTYDLQWRSESVDSNKFKDTAQARRARREGCWTLTENPPFTMNSATRSVEELKAGAFDATRHLNSVPVKSKVRLQSYSNRKPYFESQGYQPPRRLDAWNTEVTSDYIWTCDPRDQGVLGCMRISYMVSDARHVSLLGKLNEDGSTRAWRASSSWMCSAGAAPI